jgi:DNA helicase-2/ATP-dependent DNA helicase PcrA
MDLKDERNDYVTLMTIHTSKWLEQKRVFITGVEEWLFPSLRSMWEQASLEEERRLMYVAMTRAKEELYISRAIERFHFWEYVRNRESRFISEISNDCIQNYDLWEFVKSANNYFFSNLRYSNENQNKLNVKNSLSSPEWYKPKIQIQNNDISQFNIWDKVFHPKFWDGIITELNGEIATIAFPWNGVRKMNIRIAPVKKI